MTYMVYGIYRSGGSRHLGRRATDFKTRNPGPAYLLESMGEKGILIRGPIGSKIHN